PGRVMRTRLNRAVCARAAASPLSTEPGHARLWGRGRARLCSFDRQSPWCCIRMKPSNLSYLFVMFFSVLALAAVLLPESWLASSERYVLGAAFLVVAAILLPRG